MTTMKKTAQKSNKQKVTKKVVALSSGKHPGGRPTKYSQETIKVAREYLENYEEHGDQIPSIAGLAIILGIRRETLHVWAKEEGKEEISNILGAILAKQENVLINKGLTGDFNSAISKLVLGKHGYHEKVDSTLSGGDKPVTLTAVERVVVRPTNSNG
jgi:hypothetical protein